MIRDKEIQLPADNQLEKLVLGAMIDKGLSRVENIELVDEHCFYDPFHKDVYLAIKAIESKGSTIDHLLIIDHFRKSGIGKNYDNLAYRLSEIGGSFVPDCSSHVLALKEKSYRRKLFELSEFIKSNALSESHDIFSAIDYAKEKLDGILINSEKSIFTLHEAINGVYEQIKRNYDCGDTLTGIPTGFIKFDKRGGGLQKSDLVVIAAETSQGKTSLAISIADFATQYNFKGAVYSLEMKKEQIAARILSIHSGIPANEIMYSRLGPDKTGKLEREAQKLTKSNILFDDRSNSNIETIISSIRALKLKYDIDFAVIDYLQILNVNMKNSNKEAQMGEVARRLKNLAKDLDICIIALSQLNRNSADPTPNLNRLRDSGQIAEAADVVMFVYRPEVYGKYYPDPFKGASTEATAMIDVAKGRNIGLLKMLVRFHSPTTHFFDLPDGMIPQKAVEEEPF